MTPIPTERLEEMLRGDFKQALDEMISDFAKDPGISWGEAILVLEAKISEMRAELKRNE